MTKEIKHQICGDGFIQYHPVKTPRRPFDDDDIQEYARPWRPLTEQELQAMCEKWNIIYGGHVNDFAKEIETKLKDKNHG